MKLNYKHKQEKEKMLHMNIEDQEHADISDIDKETQRLKWRIYKRRYRQKKRKNAMIMKQSSSDQKSKPKGKATSSSRSNLASKVKKEISVCNLPCNSSDEHIRKKKVQKEVIMPVKKEEKQPEIHKMSANTSEGVNREIMREKWRLYKRNYRQKKRNNVLPLISHSPKIVEEDTAIYFVEENTNHEYMYEDNFSEGEQEYQYKNDESSDSYEIIEINESFDELITVKCEPSDFIECVLKPTQTLEN